MVPDELPRDLPAFLARFGTDAQCRAYLVALRWREGFSCAGCGHGVAYSHKRRLIEECAACGKQHSLLAGTMFEQTKTAERDEPHRLLAAMAAQDLADRTGQVVVAQDPMDSTEVGEGVPCDAACEALSHRPREWHR